MKKHGFGIKKLKNGEMYIIYIDKKEFGKKINSSWIMTMMNQNLLEKE